MDWIEASGWVSRWSGIRHEIEYVYDNSCGDRDMGFCQGYNMMYIYASFGSCGTYDVEFIDQLFQFMTWNYSINMI